MPASRSAAPLAAVDILLARRTAFGTARERNEALSLVRRLAASAGIAGENLPVRVILEAISGGRSVARVFKVTPLFGVGDRRARGRPVVMKIAPPAEGANEKANYEKFVRALPASCRSELLGSVRTRTHTALCYAFVGDNGSFKANTLTDHLRRGDTAKLDVVLLKLFGPLRDTWYRPALLRAESDIAQHYLQRHFYGPRSTAGTEATLAACANRYFKASRKDRRYVIGKLSFPELRAVLFTTDSKRPYRSCIVHGDLNSDNVVFCAAPPRVALVDFLKTGRGHVLEDLIAIESSIRINHPRNASFDEVLEKERRIAAGLRAPRGDRYSASILKIRAAAAQIFAGVEDPLNYQFAVAAIGLRLMLAADLSHIARARIVASALWAAKALAGET